MNCPQAEPWLLAAADEGQLPPPIREHLHGCAACRHGWQQRAAIDEALRRLPGPSASQTARDRFLTGRFAQETGRTPWRLTRWRQLGAAVAAAVVLAFVGGLLIGSRRPAVPDEVRPALVAKAYPDEATLERFLHRNLRLAGSDDPGERVRLSAAVVGDLASAALETEARSLDELALLACLYAVATDGVVAAVGQLPRPERQQMLPEILADLRGQARRAAEVAAVRSPAEAQRLAAIGETARGAADALSQGKPLPRSPLPRGGSPDDPRERLAVLVRQATALASAADPLARAEICADVADHWSEAVVFAASRGETERAERLGEQLGELVGQGMTDDDLAQADAARLAQRAEQARRKIEDNVVGAAPEAKKGLERALQAADKGVPPGLRERPDKGPRPGKEKGKGKGKAKGKPPADR